MPTWVVDLEPLAEPRPDWLQIVTPDVQHSRHDVLSPQDAG